MYTVERQGVSIKRIIHFPSEERMVPIEEQEITLVSGSDFICIDKNNNCVKSVQVLGPLPITEKNIIY